MPTMVNLNSICKSFFENKVIDNVSLTLETGKLYALIGKNGVGKSTLLRIIAKQERIDSGEMNVLGFDRSSDPADFNHHVGFVSEDFQFHMLWPVIRLKNLYSKIFPKWSEEAFSRCLKFFPLDLNKRYTDYSRGQKMQLAFALTYATQPELLLLDEITSVLDPQARKHLISEIRDYVKKGNTVVMASNIVTEIMNWTDQVLTLENTHLKHSTDSSPADSKKVMDDFIQSAEENQ